MANRRDHYRGETAKSSFSCDDQLCCTQASQGECVVGEGYPPVDVSSFPPTRPRFRGCQWEGEDSRGKELEFGLSGLFRSSFGRPCHLVQDGGSCGRRRGVAKPWVALVKRHTRVATDRVVSGVVD